MTRVRVLKKLGVGITYLLSAVLAYAPANARADYILSPTSGGVSSLNVMPGAHVDVDVVLSYASAGDSDVCSAAVFRLVFSTDGLICESYDWHAPFGNGSDDWSQPGSTTLPAAITSDLYLATHDVDTYYDNSLFDEPWFDVGAVVSVALTIPDTYSGPDQIIIGVRPDSEALQFFNPNWTTPDDMLVPTVYGAPLVLNIVPEPVVLPLLLSTVAFWGAGPRRDFGSEVRTMGAELLETNVCDIVL